MQTARDDISSHSKSSNIDLSLSNEQTCHQWPGLRLRESFLGIGSILRLRDVSGYPIKRTMSVPSTGYSDLQYQDEFGRYDSSEKQVGSLLKTKVCHSISQIVYQ